MCRRRRLRFKRRRFSGYDTLVELACDARGWSYDDWLRLSDGAKDRALAWALRQKRQRDEWRASLADKDMYAPDVATMLMLED